MYFNATKLVLFSLFITGLLASPITDQESATDFVEYSREAGKFSGTLIYYGPINGTAAITDAQSLQERTTCGGSSTAPTCSGDHAARNSVCQSLLNELYGDADVSVPESPRQICYQGDSSDNEYCCASWDKAIKSLTKGDLAPFVAKIVSKCTSNGISGKTSKIHIVPAADRLGNKCNAVCVSNRGTHC